MLRFLRRIWCPERHNDNKIEEENCYHDWEVVERRDNYWIDRWKSYYISEQDPNKRNGQYFYLDRTQTIYGHKRYFKAVRRVCLLCGECQDEIGLIEKKESEKEERKELAKKMWKNGCKSAEKE